MEFPDVYDWICRACRWKGGGIESHVLNVFADSKYSVFLRTEPYEVKMSLCFHFLEGDTSIGKSEIGRFDIGRYDIGVCSEESMQKYLLPVLLWLFFDPFILRSSKVICEAFSGYLDMVRELTLEPGIIEPTKYKLVFNSLISAGCTFFPNDMEDGLLFEILAETQQNTLLLMGLEGTHRFMGILASTLFSLSFLSSNFRLSWMQRIFEGNSSIQRSWMQCIFERVSRISYKSSTGGSWMIMFYSPLSSLRTTIKYRSLRERAHLPCAEVERESLLWALKNNLLHFVLQFEPVVDICSDCIKVCLHIDNVRCDVVPLDRISDKSIRGLPDERHFPAKICLTIGPENGFVVQSVSLSVSSPNTYKATLQSNMLGLEASNSTTFTEGIKKWSFEHTVVNNTNAKIDCTLYDTTTGKAVFNTGPPKISVLSGKTAKSIYKAFTERGGVVFTKDDYGKPITWKLDRNLEGQTLKWNVKASIWLTYWSNTDGIRYFETKCHDFSQVVDLTLLQSSSSTSK